MNIKPSILPTLGIRRLDRGVCYLNGKEFSTNRNSILGISLEQRCAVCVCVCALSLIFILLHAALVAVAAVVFLHVFAQVPARHSPWTHSGALPSRWGSPLLCGHMLLSAAVSRERFQPTTE